MNTAFKEHKRYIQRKKERELIKNIRHFVIGAFFGFIAVLLINTFNF